uniref:Uncharacterized protein n=1 Tax=Rhizophora mucronata TaxID=61149 RepID=A0A2P2QCB7_RHIMU
MVLISESSSLNGSEEKLVLSVRNLCYLHPASRIMLHMGRMMQLLKR